MGTLEIPGEADFESGMAHPSRSQMISVKNAGGGLA